VYEAIVGARFFGVSVLQETQESIAAQFARHGVDKFEGVTLSASARVPLVEHAIAQLECEQHALHDAVDHVILVGHVLDSRTAHGRPILHYARAYGSVAAKSAPREDGSAHVTPDHGVAIATS
jgi:flavin reductase (DIM6/NTAB) family NADH-FMN oxidoreductase RutF